MFTMIDPGDIVKAIFLSFITGIIGFNTFKYIVSTLYYNLKNRFFNGYWLLMITNNQNINHIDLIKLKEKAQGQIKNCKVPNGLLNSLPKNHLWKIEGKKVNDSLLLNLQLYSNQSGGCSHLLSNDINMYWSGAYLPGIDADGNRGINDSCTISLTKIPSVSMAPELIKNSDKTALREQFNISKNLKEKDYIISIIVVVYNDEENIGRCLDSILNQSMDAIQVIVVDDGSYDGTETILSRYIASKKIIYKKSIHKGKSFARNVGLSYAVGNYVLFVDSDDILECILDHLILLATTRAEDILIGGYYEKSIKYGIRKFVVESSMSKAYTIGQFAESRRELSKIRLGASWGKLYKNEILKSRDFMFEEGIFEDTIFNIELQKFTHTIYVDTVIWYQYNKSNPKSTMNRMRDEDYIVGQYRVLSRYTQFLNHLVEQKEISKTSRDSCIKSYTSDIMNRIDEKVRK